MNHTRAVFYLLCMLMLCAFCCHSASVTDKSMKGPSDNTTFAAGEWVTFLGNSRAYQEIAGPELELVGVIPGRYVTIDKPWLPVAILQDSSVAWNKLYSQSAVVDDHPLKVLFKAKLALDRNNRNGPLVLPGAMRLMTPEEADRAMCWNLNIPLLPQKSNYLPITMIVACECVSKANTQYCFSYVWQAKQDFKVLETMMGTVKVGQILHISYSYFGSPLSQQVPVANEGTRVVWICTSADKAYAAVADTPYYREQARLLAGRLASSPMPKRVNLVNLRFEGAKVAASREQEVPRLFMEEPAGSGKWVLRKEVKEVYAGWDGTVFFLPHDKVYFYRQDEFDYFGHRLLHCYYGPYEHDITLPRKPIREKMLEFFGLE